MTGAGIAADEENRDVDSDRKGVEEEEEKKLEIVERRELVNSAAEDCELRLVSEREGFEEAKRKGVFRSVPKEGGKEV